jgi:hypothetical protein
MCYGDNPWNIKHRETHNVSDQSLKLKKQELKAKQIDIL